MRYDQIARPCVLRYVIVCNIESRRHLDRSNMAGPGDLEVPIGNQGHLHVQPFRGAILDFRGLKFSRPESTLAD